MVEVDVVGFGNDERIVYGIPSKERIHVAIFGEVGSGKSETIKLLIYQNICKGQGFLLVDPHGMLARNVLELIPRKDWDKVVFISPVTLVLDGRVVRINPLESKGSQEHVVAMSFVNSLRNLYRDSWGDRLEAVLRNACNTLVEVPGSTIRDLQKLVTDSDYRKSFLEKISNSDTVNFWKNTFEKQYSKEAGSAAYNKLDKILATPPVAAILDTPASSVDFGRSLEENKFIIVDLSSGASDDVTSFLGSIILHMMYVEAKKRVDMVEQLRIPFYVYVDEAHLFSPFALREILNTMRKFNVKVTLATQTINAYPKKVADEIAALARTILCFKCDENTANMFKGVLPSRLNMGSLSLHRFAFYSQGTDSVVGVAKTAPLCKKEAEWESVARHSVQNYGELVSTGRFNKFGKGGVFPDITPCESCILLLLHDKGSCGSENDLDNASLRLTRDEIFVELCKRFGFFDVSGGISKRHVYDCLESLVRDSNLNRHIEGRDGKGGPAVQKFSISRHAYETHLSTTAIGKRAGSTLHLAAIFVLVNIMQNQMKHCVIDLGHSVGKRADILIFEPDVRKNTGCVSKYTVFSYDLMRWSKKVLAIEVETSPDRNPDQVVANHAKNFENGFDVWFAVFSESHKRSLQSILENSGIKDVFYNVIVLQREDVLRSYEKLEGSKRGVLHDCIIKRINEHGHGVSCETSIDFTKGPALARDVLELLKHS